MKNEGIYADELYEQKNQLSYIGLNFSDALSNKSEENEEPKSFQIHCDHEMDDKLDENKKDDLESFSNFINQDNSRPSFKYYNIFPSFLTGPTTDSDKDKKNGEKKYKSKGRKRKNSNNVGKHDKYYFDNITRKIKSRVLHFLYKFINGKIVGMKNLKNKIGKYTLKKINQKQTSDTHIKFNQNFLLKKVKEIFKDNISKVYRKSESDHNAKIIENLLNEEDVEIRKYFDDLFNLNFLDCLKHFRGTEKNALLDGMETFDQYIQNLDEDLDYIETLRKYLMEFEQLIMNKKPRKN